MRLEYIISDTFESYPENARKMRNVGKYDHEFIELFAEQCAENYWDNHDGYQSNWPLVFEIFLDGESKGKFDVDMESIPQFYGSKCHAQKGKDEK